MWPPAPIMNQLPGPAEGTMRPRSPFSQTSIPYQGAIGQGVVMRSIHASDSRRRPSQTPRCSSSRATRAWSRAEIDTPPPQWVPPGTDCTRRTTPSRPRSSTHASS